MSHPDLVYPPPAYSGDDGLETATLHRADAPPDLTSRSGGTVHYLATRTSTNGQFGLYACRTAANGSTVTPATSGSCPRAGFMPSGTSRARRPRCSSCSRPVPIARTTSRRSTASAAAWSWTTRSVPPSSSATTRSGSRNPMDEPVGCRGHVPPRHASAIHQSGAMVPVPSVCLYRKSRPLNSPLAQGQRLSVADVCHRGTTVGSRPNVTRA